MGIEQLGLASGPLFGGLLTEFASWRWCRSPTRFPTLGLKYAKCARFLPQSSRRRRGSCADNSCPRPPTTPEASSHVHLSLTTYTPRSSGLCHLRSCSHHAATCQYGGTTYAWSNPRIIGLFCGAGAMFIVFLVWDYHKGDEAIIPMSIARMGTVWASCMVYGLMMSNLYLASYWVPVYFQGVKGVSPIKSGIYLLAMIVAHVFAAISSGPIVNIVGYTIPVALFAPVLLSVGCGLFGTFSPSTPVGKWIGYQILYGVGRGLGIQMVCLISPITNPSAHLVTLFLSGSQSSLFKKPYHPNRSP
ncbi:hypothetical protein OCU04_003899 [Sclerotinia nivalis]|uniref:Uncharacterized protein n=1 Tax=Sclerotinia nivalis TaxID=352851 RepID=A0A9X0ASV8_9HELO|nr:hypothetical protein OCU04_003899 [Sclerotinia nivalis]